MNPLTFITGNKEKFAHLSEILGGYGIKLFQEKIDTPEIQSNDVKEVAEFSAKWAARELNHPCVVTDVGCYVDALHGFPGPFVKFVNNQLTAEQILAMIGNSPNRGVEFRECISFATPEGEVQSFIHAHKGEIIHEVRGDSQLLGKSAPFNEIIIFEGCDKTMAEYSYADAMEYFKNRQKHFHAFGAWFRESFLSTKTA